MSKPIKEALKLAQSIQYHQEQLNLAKAKLVTLEPTLEEIIADVAARLLVDEKGQLVDGGIYWYDGMAIVRVSGEVVLIRMETMDIGRVFPAPPAPAEEPAITEIPPPAVSLNGKVYDPELEL